MKKEKDNENSASGEQLAEQIAKKVAQKTRKRSLRGLLIKIGVVLALCVAVFFLARDFWWQRADESARREFLGGVFTQSSLRIEQALLGESEQQQQLIVLEQPIQIDTQIERTFAGWEVFTKTKVVHCHGTGYYSVDLSQLGQGDISADSAARSVTVTIPHAQLYNVEYDVERTEFEDTEFGLLTFIDIRLTAEQQQEFETQVIAQMSERLGEQDMMSQADEAALAAVTELLEPFVQQVAENYTLCVQFED